MTEDDLVDLQARFAFQEQTIEEMGRTLTEHQRALRSLGAELERLRELVRQLAPPMVVPPDQESPPPHY